MKALPLFFLVIILTTGYAQDIEALSKLYGSGAYGELDRMCLKILKEHPDHPEVNMVYGRSLADQEKHTEAIRYLLKATVTDAPPYARAWSYAYLGSCYFTVDSIEKSRECLLKCIGLNATKNVTAYATRRLAYYGFGTYFTNWEVVDTDNFRFLFQENSDVKDKHLFSQERESVFEELIALFPAELPGKIDFFVWNNNDDGVKAIGASPGFARPEELLIHCRYNQTRGHEMTHIIIHHSFHPKTKSRLINEGLAVLYDFSGRNKMNDARKAIQSSPDTVSIKEMWMRGAAFDESILYPVGGAWLEFLETQLPPEKFRNLIQNQSFESYGDPEEMEKLMLEFETLLRKP